MRSLVISCVPTLHLFNGVAAFYLCLCMSFLNISWIWPPPLLPLWPKPHHLTPGSHEQSANRASCSWSWSNQPLEEPFWDIRHAWAPLCSKPSDDSHLTQSKIHSSYHGPQGPHIWPTHPCNIVFHDSRPRLPCFRQTLLFAPCTTHQNTPRPHPLIFPRGLCPTLHLPRTFSPEELQESPLHISSGMSSNVIHQEGFP